MVLAIAQTESHMTYGVKHPDKNTIGIGGIKKFHKLSVNRDSLQAIEQLYLRYLSKYKGNNKKALMAYKGTKNNMKSFNKTWKIYKRIKNEKERVERATNNSK